MSRRLGFTALQKCTSAIRQLAYGKAADSMDEYLKMAEKTSRDSLFHFCEGIISLYGKKYLRKPTKGDIHKLYDAHESVHGLPGMLGSIDCMHWEWENCPTAWRGQHQRGDHPRPTLMLEAVASNDLWIWHAFFGVAGSNNDINVLDQSPVFDDIENGVAPGSSFIANDNEYNFGYYLGDGIYPKYATIVKAFTCPQERDEKRWHFKRTQESARKDISILKKKWHIISHLAHKGRAICTDYEEDEPNNTEITNEQRQENRRIIRCSETFTNLRTDLMENLWSNRNYH
ncbi:hypothetical protein L1987_62303 [Smallanthus sonchifolius]|uniref:Uncharacterized protein n=1 Tax=Smallanthus sonchifolius TaxID=185202 RepID=A0ACB9CA80_9ASTR|nr:hypothetical protein L1987_62303 [Smallanthus sonchifolius]